MELKVTDQLISLARIEKKFGMTLYILNILLIKKPSSTKRSNFGLSSVDLSSAQPNSCNRSRIA